MGVEPHRGRVGDAEQHIGRKQGYALNISPGGSLAYPHYPQTAAD